MDSSKIQALLETLIVQVQQLSDRLDRVTTDFSEFSERFEEVMTNIEDERRLDLAREYD